MLDEVGGQPVGLAGAPDDDQVTVTRVEQNALEGVALFLLAACGYGVQAAGRITKLDLRMGAKILDMLKTGARACILLQFQLLQRVPQRRAARELHMRCVPSRLARADSHMQELQVRRKWTRGGERRFQKDAVRITAADGYEDGFHGS